MKKKTIALCLALLMLCGLFCACGAGEKGAEKTPAASTEGLTFVAASEVTEKDLIESLGRVNVPKDAYVCFIDEDAPEEVSVPSKHNGAPVAALFGNGKDPKRVRQLTLEEGVVLIDGLFSGEGASLVSVTLPAGTEYIGGSFCGCSALERVAIGGISGVVRDSFCGLPALKELTIGKVDRAELVGTFKKLDAIEKITFTDTVELENYTIGEEESANSYLFYKSETLSEVVFAGRVIKLPESFCWDCKALSKLTFKGQVDMIAKMDFNDCEGLRSLTFEDEVETIDEHAFGGCGMESLTFTRGVGKIGAYSFQSCDDLTSVSFGGGIGELTDCFALCKKLETVEFGGDVDTVDGALCKCPALKSVTFGGDVGTITGAFIECPELETVTFKGAVKEITYASFNSSDKVVLEGLPDGVKFGTDELAQRFVAENRKYQGYYDKVNEWSEKELKEWALEHAAGQTLDGAKEISSDAAVKYADVLNGPVIYNSGCTDCPYDEYGPEAARDAEYFVDTMKELKKDHPNTVYTDEKALAVAEGRSPLVVAVAESMGYIPVDYVDRDDPDHIDTLYYEMMRVSFWNIETGELLAWYQHRDGEAPAEYRSSDKYDYVYRDKLPGDFYFFKGGYGYPEALLWNTVYPGSE